MMKERNVKGNPGYTNTTRTKGEKKREIMSVHPALLNTKE